MSLQEKITYRTMTKPNNYFAKTITRPSLLNRMPGGATVSTKNVIVPRVLWRRESYPWFAPPAHEIYWPVSHNAVRSDSGCTVIYSSSA